MTENTPKAPYLHEKHKNTRKKGRKYTFFQIDKILKIVPRLDGYIWFPFFPGSRTDFKLPYDHILFWSKGDQNYYNTIEFRTRWSRQEVPFFLGYGLRKIDWELSHEKYIRINFNIHIECQQTRTVLILNTNIGFLQFENVLGT